MRRRYSRKTPTLDSQRARAGAQLFLTGARSLDGITPEWLARTYNLEAKTADYMLTIARARRKRTG